MENKYSISAMFEGLFEAAPDANMLVDGEGRITRVNRQTELMFGYDREELLGKPVEILMPARFRGRHVQHRSTYYASPRLRSMGAGLELHGRRKDGTQFPVDITLSPLHTEEGTFVISVIRDITERKQMEGELAEVHRQLMEGREAERLHVAQELHDGPLQDLVAVSYRLTELWSLLPDEISTGQVVAAQATLQKALTALRTISHELRPPVLAPFGLEKAIRSHIEEFRQAHPEPEVELDLTADGQKLPEPMRLALFRIYQQALNNVVHHADASHISIRFTLDAERVVLQIQDDGRGFQMPRRQIVLIRQGHLGLVGMAERAQAIGGDLDVVTAPGEGTLIRVVVPRFSEQTTTDLEG